MAELLVGIEEYRRGTDGIPSFGELELDGEEVEDSGELEDDGVASRTGRGRLAYSLWRLNKEVDLLSRGWRKKERRKRSYLG